MLRKTFYLKKLIAFIAAAMLCVGLPVHGFATQLSPELAAVDAYLEQNFPATHMPGLSVSIVDANAVLYSKTFGNFVNPDAPVILGSISKSFTAVAILQLAEKGLVDLDAPVTDYLHAEIDDKVTLRHLLNHSSGLLTYQTKDDLTVHDSFGSHVYANINYTLLGDIVEAVSGVTYGEYIKRNIFEPLRLARSYTSIGEAGVIAPGHQNYFGFSVERAAPYPENNDARGYLSVPAGYIISSTSDMGRYLQAYLRDGESILSPESVNSILYDSVPVPGADENYAMGWIEAEGYKERLLYHGGLVQNYNTVMCLLPDSGRAVVMLFNMNDYFVANELSSSLCIGVVRLLMGMDAEGIGHREYLIPHLLIGLICFLMLLISVFPLLRLRRWACGLRDNKLRSPLLKGLALHLAYPLLLISIPLLLGVPYFAAWAFAPDVMLAIMSCASLALICGAAKIILWMQGRGRAVSGKMQIGC